MERILQILDQKCLPSISLIRQLCRQVSDILAQEPNVLRIDSGVKVVGSLYGQYFDLLEIVNEQIPVNYLFLGNYIGYGEHSLETILLLFCLKVKCPSKVSLLRGAQQTQQLSINRGLLEQVYEKYGSDEPWRLIESVLLYLPLAAVIGQTYFAVAGGIQNYSNINQMRTISRCSTQIEKSGLFWDHLNNQKLSFGKQIEIERIQKFLSDNMLKMIIRGNGVYREGFERLGEEVISISSCPYFQKKYNNEGSILVIQEDLSCELIQFKRVKQSDDSFKSILN